MKKVLVVEDEKMIRAGIVTMIKRSHVPVEEVLQARNGEDALTILKEQEIDLLLTDIRMPKMDGIELIKQAGKLPHVPLMIVVSGYDDFNYAVEVLRQGVRDYLLKPIERDKLEAVLAAADAERRSEEEEQNEKEQTCCQQLKYLLLNPNISEEEIAAIEKQCSSIFDGTEYVLCCLRDGYGQKDGYAQKEEYERQEQRQQQQRRNEHQDMEGMKQVQGMQTTRGVQDIERFPDIKEIQSIKEAENIKHVQLAKNTEETGEVPGICLRDVEGSMLVILRKDSLEHNLACLSASGAVGISSPYQSIKGFKKAYEEALLARKTAFIRCAPFYFYRPDADEYEVIPDDFSEHFVQLIGTPKVEDALSKFASLRFKAKQNKIGSTQILTLTDQIISKIFDTFGKVIELQIEEYKKLEDPLQYKNAEEYYPLLETWIRDIQQTIVKEFEDYKNKEKISQAIRFIKENYKTDLNMAVVSNHISMNYSLFSLNFKQYTGMNFVNYLKQIRMDEAKRLLEDTEEKVIDISQMIGYDNEKHFMKTFKNLYGVSPSEWRKNAGLRKREEK